MMKTVLQIDDAALIEGLREFFSHRSTGIEPVICLGPTYVGLRCQGMLIEKYWLDQEELFTGLSSIVPQTLYQKDVASVDTVELCLTRNFRRVSPKVFKSKFPNSKRGIRGIQLHYGHHQVIYSPFQMLAENLSFRQVFKQFLTQTGASRADFKRGGEGSIEAFEAQRILISLKPEVTVTVLYRDSLVASMADLSHQTLEDMATDMGCWLIHMGKDGNSLPDHYIPGRGKVMKGNNLASQFLAVRSLICYSLLREQPEYLALADQNLNHHLAQLLIHQSALGSSELCTTITLADRAAAALAIWEHPQRDRYTKILQGLDQDIETMWQPDGSFTVPADYPEAQFHAIDVGLALLFWAAQIRQNPNPQRLEQCRCSFLYYRLYYREHPHPAFVPWHSQAYALLFDTTQDPQMLEFIFDMMDGLLPLQQWEQLRSLDMRGRFYSAAYRDFGPTQAAATGLVLQGLAEAYRLAVQSRDLTRANAYELAIWRGFRFIRQLQFKDSLDMFYVKERSQVQGAVRSAVYDHCIDLANVQHSLSALLTVTNLPAFPDQAPQPRAPFRRLKQAVTIAPLIAEITEKSDFWFYDTSRQAKLMPQQETQSIFLRRAAKPFPPGTDNARDVHASCPTEIAPEFPVVMTWVEQFVEEIGGELGRVNIVRLAPQGRVYSHIDYGEYYRLRDRYHLVLHSSGGSWMKCGSEAVTMQPGELWWFDNKQPHEAFNPSEDWRIHLIFDVLPLAARA